MHRREDWSILLSRPRGWFAPRMTGMLSMEHQPLRHLRDIADVEPGLSLLEGRRARLERWAEILDREPARAFTTLEEIEFVPRRLRAGASRGIPTGLFPSGGNMDRGGAGRI